MNINPNSSRTSNSFPSAPIGDSKISADGSTPSVVKNVWTTYVTPFAESMIGSAKYSFDADITTYQDRTPGLREAVVSWDSGLVQDETDSAILCSKNFGPCIAVGARGVSEGGKKTYGLHHVFSNADSFEETLHTVINKVDRGVVDIFISGGESFNRTSNQNKADVDRIIDEAKRNTPKDCKISVKDDKFGKFSDFEFTAVTETHYVALGTPNVAWVGFLGGNPVQYVDIKKPTKLSLEDIETVVKTRPR